MGSPQTSKLGEQIQADIADAEKTMQGINSVLESIKNKDYPNIGVEAANVLSQLQVDLDAAKQTLIDAQPIFVCIGKGFEDIYNTVTGWFK